MPGEDAAKDLLLAAGKYVLTRRERLRAEVRALLDLAAEIRPMGDPDEIMLLAQRLLTFVDEEAERVKVRRRKEKKQRIGLGS